MRIGINPARNDSFTGWPPIMALVVTHLPNREHAYHRTRFPIIRACLLSMRKHAGQALPVMVWDNGSDAEFRRWLVEEYKPEYLTLAPNVGKPKARQAVLKMLPSETIVCFSDDDMLYYPGWLQPHLELLDGFPNAGLVSGWPVRFSFSYGNVSASRFALERGKLEVGRFIPPEQEADYAVSIGVDPKAWVQQQGNISQADLRITYNGMTAYAEAQHCQWVGRAGVIAPFADNDYAPRRQEIEFDSAIDRAGLMRLTTTERYCRHMGNALDPVLQGELEGFGLL